MSDYTICVNRDFPKLPAFLGDITGEVTPAILRQALHDIADTMLIAEHPIRENCFILARSEDELQAIIDNANECAAVARKDLK